MKYLLKQRMPNFIEHNPNELEQGEINSLKEIHNFEFMTFYRLQNQTNFLFTLPIEDKYTDHDLNVYVYNPEDIGSFKDCIWVAKLYELEEDE